MKKLLIGLTGGIGSGKSEAASIIKAMGFPLINSDEIAKKLLIEDEFLKREIIKHFGNDVYNQNKLNKKFLAAKVFSSPEKVKLINSLVHPKTIKLIKTLADELFEENNLVFVESALIFETAIQDMFDYIILIYSDDEIRIERVCARDKVDKSKVIERMKNQIPQEEKKEMSDFVIMNNSTIEELNKRITFVVNLIKNIAD